MSCLNADASTARMNYTGFTIRRNDVVDKFVQLLSTDDRRQLEAMIKANAGGTGGGSGLPAPEGPNLQLVTDADGNWVQAERLGYPTTGIVDIVPETTLVITDAVDGMAVITQKPTQPPEVGKTYTVDWNGTPYTCTAQVLEEVADGGDPVETVALGNIGVMTGGENTGEPFIIIYAPPEMTGEYGYHFLLFIFEPLTETSEIKVKITGEGTVYKKISFDYLPEGVGGVESGVVLPEVTLVEDEADQGVLIVTTPLNMPIVDGGKYTVVWNGAEYECTAQAITQEGMTAVVFGNFGLMTGEVDTGEPFIIIDGSAYGVPGVSLVAQPLDGSTTATLSISGEVIRKIPEEYLDIKDNKTITITIDGALNNKDAAISVDTPISILDGMSVNEIQRALRVVVKSAYAFEYSVFGVEIAKFPGLESYRAIQFMISEDCSDYAGSANPAYVYQWIGDMSTGESSIRYLWRRDFLPPLESNDTHYLSYKPYGNTGYWRSIQEAEYKQQLGITQLETDVASIKEGKNVDSLVNAVIAALPIYNGEVITE